MASEMDRLFSLAGKASQERPTPADPSACGWAVSGLVLA